MFLNFEETELINSLFEETENSESKGSMIERLSNAKVNTEDPELVTLAEQLIEKIQGLDESTIQRMLQALPIDPDFSL